jgi:hypothetical protein
MKKTVQIVTIPLNKDSWSKGDIIINDEHTFIAIYNSEGFGDWQAQQLLVLSDDDEIQKDDIVYDLVNNRVELIISVNKESEVCKFKGGAFDLKYTKKLIASYPQLEGTLPISKETVQTWIDAGTPEESSVEMIQKKPVGCSILNCEGMRTGSCDCFDEKWKIPKHDPQGNLLLGFPLNTEPLRKRQEEAQSKMWDETNFSHKLSIPTDKEIEEKAKSIGNDGGPFSTRVQNYAYMYQEGYKQALKDLGHE